MHFHCFKIWLCKFFDKSQVWLKPESLNTISQIPPHIVQLLFSRIVIASHILFGKSNLSNNRQLNQYICKY